MKSIIKTSLFAVCLSIFIPFTYAENDDASMVENTTNNTEQVSPQTNSSADNLSASQARQEETNKSTHRRAKDFGWGMLIGIIVTTILCFTRPIRMSVKHCKRTNKRKNMTNTMDEGIKQSPILPVLEETKDKGNGSTTPPTNTESNGKDDKTPKVPSTGDIPTGSTTQGGAPTEPPAPPSVPITPKYKTSFAVDNADWAVVGTSVIGSSHVSMDIPCQDNCKYEYLGDGWGIAVTSDGAGSAKHSHVGSSIVAVRTIEYLKKVIEKKEWKTKNILPSDAVWTQHAYNVFHYIYEDLVNFGKAKGVDHKDLSATVIVLIHTPNGVLSAHIGDGRAGYKDINGQWKSIITPHKGDEANQTIFITSDFWSVHNYVMSDVTVPECVVIREPITAFVLMSDGCEHTAWLCNQYDESKKRYYDPNTPYAKLLDNCCEIIITDHEENTPMDERAAKWENFIVAGNKKFEVESDDKTLLLGVLCKQKISDDCIYPQTRID